MSPDGRRLFVVNTPNGTLEIFDIGWLHWAIYVAMWFLAAASVVTVFQRVLAVRNSAGARDVLPIARPAGDEEATAS